MPRPTRFQMESTIRNHVAFESMHQEVDGCFGEHVNAYWIYLKSGWICPDMECGTIHEPTLSKAYALFMTIVRCNHNSRNERGECYNCGNVR